MRVKRQRSIPFLARALPTVTMVLSLLLGVISYRIFISLDTKEIRHLSVEGDVSVADTIKHRIPHRLIFTHSINILEEKRPPLLYDNIERTTSTYRSAWNEPDAPVWFLDNDACYEAIKLVEPKLVDHFEKEKNGAFKGDICRIAALYLQGGYYFDVDMVAVRAVPLPTEVHFSTVWMPNKEAFFQSFIASEAGSPMLKEALARMLQFYETVEQERTTIEQADDPFSQLETLLKRGGHGLTREMLQESVHRGSSSASTQQVQSILLAKHKATLHSGLLGPSTLRDAYDKTQNLFKSTEVVVLDEIDLDMNKNLYPALPKQDGVGRCCNYVVHDPTNKTVYFFSRLVGASQRCASKDRRTIHAHLQ